MPGQSKLYTTNSFTEEVGTNGFAYLTYNLVCDSKNVLAPKTGRDTDSDKYYYRLSNRQRVTFTPASYLTEECETSATVTRYKLKLEFSKEKGITYYA